MEGIEGRNGERKKMRGLRKKEGKEGRKKNGRKKIIDSWKEQRGGMKGGD